MTRCKRCGNTVPAKHYADHQELHALVAAKDAQIARLLAGEPA